MSVRDQIVKLVREALPAFDQAPEREPAQWMTDLAPLFAESIADALLARFHVEFPLLAASGPKVFQYEEEKRGRESFHGKHGRMKSLRLDWLARAALRSRGVFEPEKLLHLCCPRFAPEGGSALYRAPQRRQLGFGFRLVDVH